MYVVSHLVDQISGLFMTMRIDDIASYTEETWAAKTNPVIQDLRNFRA